MIMVIKNFVISIMLLLLLLLSTSCYSDAFVVPTTTTIGLTTTKTAKITNRKNNVLSTKITRTTKSKRATTVLFSELDTTTATSTTSNNNTISDDDDDDDDDDITTTSTITTTMSSKSSFTEFDYNAHWYPVNWIHDVKPNQPTKVTLFDIDYVIATNNDKTKVITALKDTCPHKSAALSEGRIVPDTNYIQCAYHGWSFNGNNGTCIQIPQSIMSSSSYSKRYCAKSIPAIIHQQMIWLWPGPVLQDNNKYPTPPTIPELDDPNFVMTPVVREFPIIDWTLLISNILDPDHGIFAHQAYAFDWYTATSTIQQNITQSYPNNGWNLKVQVPAIDKLLKQDRMNRGKKEKKIKKKQKEQKQNSLLATSVFYAPTTISLSRRNVNDDTTSFISGFWVCPVGTGRSKFFSCGIAKVPKWFPRIPRWIVHISLNDFLDQDTVLVASQNSPVLMAEMNGIKRSNQLYNYASPTDKSVRLIDQFWDMTTWKVPNRNITLQQLYQNGVLQQGTPSREVILDRKTQHLNICHDSQDTVRNCILLRNISYMTTISWLFHVIWKRSLTKKYKWIPIISILIGYITEKIRKCFYYNYPEWKRNRDLKKISKTMWLDPK